MAKPDQIHPKQNIKLGKFSLCSIWYLSLLFSLSLIKIGLQGYKEKPLPLFFAFVILVSVIIFSDTQKAHINLTHLFIKFFLVPIVIVGCLVLATIGIAKNNNTSIYVAFLVIGLTISFTFCFLPTSAPVVSARLTPEQLFKDYGEDIFRHERFKELTGYKQQWDSVAPIVGEYGGAEELAVFNQHLGPVWKALGTLDNEKANAVWQKLYPVFMAILNNQDIDPFFSVTHVPTAVSEDDDPLKKEQSEIKTQFNG